LEVGHDGDASQIGRADDGVDDRSASAPDATFVLLQSDQLIREPRFSVSRSAQRAFSPLAYAPRGSEKFNMRRNEFRSTSRPSASGAVQRGSATESLWAVHQRLANAERELRVQFTRIAQLQAQLDVLVGALRRSPDGRASVMGVSAERATDTASCVEGTRDSPGFSKQREEGRDRDHARPHHSVDTSPASNSSGRNAGIHHQHLKSL
jgi:hypothetical protein